MGISAGGGDGGVAGAGGELVFEWDRLTTSQFESAAVFADGGAVGSLSVVAIPERGNALRLTSTAGTTAHLAFLAVAPIVFPDERRDLIIEMEIFDIIQGAGGYGGAVILADDVGTYHAVNHLSHGVAEWASRVDAASRLTTGTTGIGAGSLGGLSRWHVRGRKPNGAPPEISSWLEAWNETQHRNSRPRRSGSTAQLGGLTAFGTGTALALSWDALACDRWGICLQSSGGNPLPTNFDILDLRVFRL